MLLTYGFLVAVAISILLIVISPKRIIGTMGAMSIVALSVVSIAGYVAALISKREGSFISTFRHSLFGRIDVVVDDMSGLFLILVSVLFSVGAIYGIGYLNTYDKRVGQTRLHWLTLMLTFVGMVVMMTTDNMIIFLIGWEFMAIGSFFAVIFESEKPLVLKSGLNYFIQSHIAVLMLTGAFVWVYSYSGTTSFEGFKIFMESATAKELCVMMFLLVGGFGFKAGIVPFHSWLPYAHPAAPSHVSALMSGVIVKAGIYGIIRFGSYVRYSAADITTEIGLVILALGVISGLYGIINAAVHRDFKRMLAYCTIENIGIIVMGIGVGFIGMGESNYFITVMGFGAALLHTINHAIFKSLLFFGAGNVYIMTHTRNMEELGGLIKLMPRTAFVFLIGALAIGGLPPFGGFVSEWILYYSFIKGMTMSDLMIPAAMVVSGACLAVIGGVSMLTFTKSFGVIFLGEPRKMLVHQPHEVKSGMLKTSYILIGLIVMFVLFARQLFEFSTTIITDLFGLRLFSMETMEVGRVADILGTLSIVMVVFLAIMAAMVYVRFKFIEKREVSYSGTWGCGYMRPIKGIQYTGKSFARTLIELFKIFLPTSTRYKELTTEEIFPKERSHMSSDSDFVEKRIIEPVVGGLFKGLDKFQFIQNGNLQLYIVYGLAWVIILILTMAFI